MTTSYCNELWLEIVTVENEYPSACTVWRKASVNSVSFTTERGVY